MTYLVKYYMHISCADAFNTCSTFSCKQVALYIKWQRQKSVKNPSQMTGT